LSANHQFALIFGKKKTKLGSMFIGFLRFLGDASERFLFQLVVNLIAIAFMIKLCFRSKNIGITA